MPLLAADETKAPGFAGGYLLTNLNLRDKEADE